MQDAAMDAGSRTERAYQRLRQEILVGDLAPNERLRVADLEERFELGLTPIREALARLASEGLVSMEARRGARVLETSPAELADLMKTRREIERLCLTESILRGDSRWEAEVIAALYLLGRAPLPEPGEKSEMALEWEANHRRFHFALVNACGSEWLLRFWNQLVDHSQRYRKIRFEGPLVAKEVQAEHQAIVDAVLRRDVAAAVALMDGHLRDTEEAALAALRQAR